VGASHWKATAKKTRLNQKAGALQLTCCARSLQLLDGKFDRATNTNGSETSVTNMSGADHIARTSKTDRVQRIFE
jgi:hypothetical protein